MNVCYDYQIFSSHARGGIAKYFAQLACFMSSTGWSTRLPFKYSINQHYFEYGGTGLVRLPVFKWNEKVCRSLNKIGRTSLNTCDVWHSTYYDTALLKDYAGGKMVATVHDMIPELFPQYYAGKRDPGKEAYIRNAARIIAVSDNTKKDVCKIYGVDPAVVDVVHHGIDLRDDAVEPLAVPERYLLFVGNRHNYKNFQRLLLAFKRLKQRHSDLSLLCIGIWPFSDVEKERLRELDVQDVKFVHASDTQLRYAMRHAELFVFPSLYEGFGIPIIEAMLLDCPTALSNASCFPEIAQDAAAYFDPNDEGSIFETLDKLLADKALRKKLTDVGRVLVKEYSLDRMLRGTAKVYEAVARSVL